MRFYDGRGPLPPDGLHSAPWVGLPSDFAARRRALSRTALYRFYSGNDVLLYVGITSDLEQRWRKHAAEAPWWHLQGRYTVEWYASRTAAEVAERLAIKSERPAWNMVHSMPGFGADRSKLIDRPSRSVAAYVLFRAPVVQPAAPLIDHKAAVARLAALALTVDVNRLPWRKRRPPSRWVSGIA